MPLKIGGLVLGGALSSIGQRKSAKKQARAEQEGLRLNYNFSMNDSDREMMFQQEQIMFEKFNNELMKNEKLMNIEYGSTITNMGGDTINNIGRMIRTQDIYNQMRNEVQIERSLEEFNRYQENQRFLMDRGIQSSKNSVPSFFESAMSGALSGAAKGVNLLTPNLPTGG